MEEEIKREEVDETKIEETTKGTLDKDKSEGNKLWAILCYLGVLVVIPFLLKKDSEFVQFHVKQGLVLLAGWVLAFLPFGPILAIILIVLSIVGIVNVLSGDMKKLPLTGELAEKISL
ncbi:MAG: hypothetical protein ACD_5C00290G0001 [uncultured bacterium]|nr:MAG: hypothetical protein ACD_5C00290G0001 [uncultured bacterium]